MKIGVIIAMDIEYRQMHDAIGGDQGRLGDNEIVLWQCGIGKVNAAVGTMRLIQEHHPDAIISTGLAGGIDPLMQVKDVLAATCKPVVLSSGEMPSLWPNNFAGYGEIDVYAGLVEVLNRYVTGIDTISRHQPAAVGCRLSADGLHVSIDASVAEPVTLRLFSVGGQLVASRRLCGGGETVIPMTAAGSGVYVLQSQSKDKAAAGSVVFRK